jgi:hypothetical protein
MEAIWLMRSASMVAKSAGLYGARYFDDHLGSTKVGLPRGRRGSSRSSEWR